MHQSAACFTADVLRPPSSQAFKETCSSVTLLLSPRIYFLLCTSVQNFSALMTVLGILKSPFSFFSLDFLLSRNCFGLFSFSFFWLRVVPLTAIGNRSAGYWCYSKSHPSFPRPEVALLAVKEGRRGLQFAMSTNNMSDPRRPNKVLRYKPPPSECNPALDDPTPDYMNLLGMIFSMCGLMLKLKWCAWVAVYCSFISFANSRSSEDTKQMMSSFMLSISAVVMSYLQNPQPMTPPW